MFSKSSQQGDHISVGKFFVLDSNTWNHTNQFDSYMGVKLLLQLLVKVDLVVMAKKDSRTNNIIRCSLETYQGYLFL